MGVAPAAAVLSLLDGVGLVCAPPELCTTPVRGSGVEVAPGEEGEPSWPSTELCTIPDVELGDEPVGEADEPVDDVGADSDDELDADEAGDELEELESVGSAIATPTVFAIAAPTPSVTDSTPTRTMHRVFTGKTPYFAVRILGTTTPPTLLEYQPNWVAVHILANLLFGIALMVSSPRAVRFLFGDALDNCGSCSVSTSGSLLGSDRAIGEPRKPGMALPSVHEGIDTATVTRGWLPGAWDSR